MDATTTAPIPHPDPPITPAEDALTPIVHIGTAPTRTLSGGRMHLSGGQATAPQRHDTTETILAILSGHLAILTGNHMAAFHPRTRDMIYIPATLPSRWSTSATTPPSSHSSSAPTPDSAPTSTGCPNSTKPPAHTSNPSAPATSTSS